MHVSHKSTTIVIVQLQGKTDARFVEAAFKIFRDKFGLRPVITAAQFLEQASLFFSNAIQVARLHALLCLQRTLVATCRDLLSGSLCCCPMSLPTAKASTMLLYDGPGWLLPVLQQRQVSNVYIICPNTASDCLHCTTACCF